jgi:hypothetical protein
MTWGSERRFEDLLGCVHSFLIDLRTNTHAQLPVVGKGCPKATK